MLRNLLSHCLFTGGLVFLIVCIFPFRSPASAETTVETAIAKAEKRIIKGEYYQAILALEPLLTSKAKSEAQEEALWIAHTLTIKWEREIIEKGLWGKAIYEKIGYINQFGADFDSVEINFGYRFGFLQRLIDAYPKTHKHPVAEYALIQKGFPVPQDIDETLKALHAYIEKYKKTGRAEVYRAYLDIAHIHHGLWACITFHDHIDVATAGPFSTGDPEKDAELAEAHKAEAMTYYRKYHLNPHKLPDDDSYERLKKEEASGWEFILFGC